MLTIFSRKSLNWIFFLFLFAFIIKPDFIFSQSEDTVSVKVSEKKSDKKEKYKFQGEKKTAEVGWFSDHSPKKATYLSLVPGLGQIYNRKYWKLPIVYAGFAVTGYFAYTNRIEYIKYKDAYICASNAEADTAFTCTDPLAQKYSVLSLENIKDGYRRNMELSYIFMGVWYILQMLDATVDAHLFYWEVNDDISIRSEPIIRPNVIPGSPAGTYGVKVSVNF